jgi:hypothetical protein
LNTDPYIVIDVFIFNVDRAIIQAALPAGEGIWFTQFKQTYGTARYLCGSFTLMKTGLYVLFIPNSNGRPVFTLQLPHAIYEMQSMVR